MDSDSIDSNQYNKLLALCDAVREESVSDADWDRVQLLLQDPTCRRIYVDYMMMVGQLSESLEDLGVVRSDESVDARQMMIDALLSQQVRGLSATKVPSLVTGFEEPASRGNWTTKIVLATSLALLVWLLSWGGVQSNAVETAAFATMQSADGCKWGNGSLPTEQGLHFGAGRLDLLEGMAVVILDNGVRLTLEAPVSLSLDSLTRCEVYAGQLLSYVPRPEIGFTVTTPTGEILDLGTEFAVHVDDDGSTGVHVLSGEVSLTSFHSKGSRRLVENETTRIGTSHFTEPRVAAEASISIKQHSSHLSKGTTAVSISTALGRGRDAFVQRDDSVKDESPDLLLVKKCIRNSVAWDRKVYLAFDLESIDGVEVERAELRLNLAPSGVGFAARQPDATFFVYGVVDDSLDGWKEDLLTWRNAPANTYGADAVNTKLTVPLGGFKVLQGVQTGCVQLESERLRDFIRSNTNGIITLIVVRETQEVDGSGLVHGFVSKEHSSGLAPLLRLDIRESPKTQN